MQIIPLGAGCEVGRSCVILRFKGSTIMFDCGVHPAFNGLAALPYFDEFDLSEVDLLLVTHFHLDHCGAVPYFTEKTNFTGRVFMTHATKAIYKIILNDYVRVTSGEDKLYDEKDLMRSMERIELIDYHQVVTHKGVSFTALNAGHVLGAAMFNVEVAGVRALYTGDFSCHEDRHLRGAEAPSESPHVLIVESTYGVQTHGPADVREARFTSFVHKVVARGGRCLIPVFALGRAQELLLILGTPARAEARRRWCAPPACRRRRGALRAPLTSRPPHTAAPTPRLLPSRRRVLAAAPGAALGARLLRLLPRQEVHEGLPRVHQHDERAHPEGARGAEPVEIHARAGAQVHGRLRRLAARRRDGLARHAAGARARRGTLRGSKPEERGAPRAGAAGKGKDGEGV